MLTSAITLGLVGLAAASPIAVPVKSQSQAFNLVVHVLDHDFSPSIEGYLLNSIHVGAGINYIGVGSNLVFPSIYYQNGTAEEARNGKATTLSDIGTPPGPAGFSLSLDQGSKTVSTAHLDGGSGTPGLALSRSPEPDSFLVPETFLVCDVPLEYYQGQHFKIVKNVASTVGSDGKPSTVIPADCAAVRLIPQCTELNSLPDGSDPIHGTVVTSACYKDVASQFGNSR